MLTGPFFVVGASRSGTTLMARVLGRSGAARTLAEVHFFERLWRPERRDIRLERGDAVQLGAALEHTQHRGLVFREGHVSDHLAAGEQIADAAGDHPTPLLVYRAFLEYSAAKVERSTACEQTPRNVFFLREILDTFPEARVVNMVRDPRAVLLSQKFKWRRRALGEPAIPNREVWRMRANYHPVVTARLWKASVDAADAIDDPRILTVPFENLLADPQHTVERVAEHCGAPFRSEMLDVPHMSSSVAPDEPDQVGIRTDRAGAWRDSSDLSATEIALCERVAGEAMRRHGYTLNEPRVSPAALVLSYGSILPKLAAAAVLNIQEVGNPITAARRRLRHAR